MTKLMQSGQIANYNSTDPTYEDGDAASLHIDSTGALKVTQATAIDETNDGIRAFDDDYSYEVIKTATTTTVKSGSGNIKEIRVLGGTLGNITVYDNTAGSGTEIVPIITPAGATVLKKSCAFSTGLTIVTAAATIVVVSYR